MANEAVLAGAPTMTISRTVADANALAVGTVVILSSSPNTVTAHSTHTESFAGIVARGKDANDGQTALPVWVEGLFLMEAEGTVTYGELVCLGTAANQVRSLGAVSIEKLASIVGRAESTGTGQVYIRIGRGGF